MKHAVCVCVKQWRVCVCVFVCDNKKLTAAGVGPRAVNEAVAIYRGP